MWTLVPFDIKIIKMKFIFSILLLTILSLAQSGNLTGYVFDQTRQPLIGANVIISGSTTGAATDENGFFEIKNVEYGSYKLEVSSVGYQKKSVDIIFNKEYRPIRVILNETSIETRQIIVSAGKYEQNIEDLTVSTAVIPPELIESRNITQVDNLLRYVSGISMAEEQMSIRGSSGYSMGAGSRVLVAIDGVPLYTGDTGEIVWEFVPITDVEQIEVIKGPASSLYGSTAIGGVVNIITKKAPKKPLFHLSSHGGVYDKPSIDQWRWTDRLRSYYGYSLTHSNSFGNFGYTISYKRENDTGYREGDHNKRHLVYGKLNYDFSDKTSLTFLGNYLSMNRGQFNFWKDSRNALVPPDADRDQLVVSDRFFGALTFKHKFSDNFSLQLKPSLYSSDFEGRGKELTPSTATLWRNELITNFSPNENWTFIIGSEQTHSKVSSTVFSSPKFFGASGYIHTEFKGIDKLTATLGVRYDYIKVDSVDGANAVTPRFGLNYKLFNDFTLRGSIGTGFRAPTPAEVFTTISIGGVDIKKNTDLTYETSLSFEVGAIYKPLPNLYFDAAFFQTDYNNFIEPNFINDEGGLAIKFINLDKARIQGSEIVVDYKIIPGLLDFNIGYTYLWSQDLNTKKAMKYRPRHRVYASANFTPYPFELGIYYRYWSRIEEIDETIVQPPVELIVEGDLRVEVYVWDASAGYNFNLFDVPLKLSANVYNIFNYNYVEFLGNIRPLRNFSLRLDMYF